MPRKRARVPLQRTFTKAEFARINKGFAPQSMDDRWFIFFEKGWLYFHRSWTGRCIFQIRFKPQKHCYAIADAWAKQDLNRYEDSNVNNKGRLISNLIDHVLLGKEVSF